jgi:DNA-binding NarL/FixJ family response regulator
VPATQEWDLVISEYSMPYFSGIAGLELLKKSGFDIPFVVVSGTIGEDLAVAAMKAGAQPVGYS